MARKPRLKSSTNKRVLKPGLKRSKTGAIVRDRRKGRVSKRRTQRKRGIGPYRKIGGN